VKKDHSHCLDHQYQQGGGGKVLLIACHCGSDNDFHYQLYHHSYKQPPVALTAENYERLGYQNVLYVDIDPQCPQTINQYRQWDMIPDNSVDVIWPQYCPLGSFFYESETDRLDLEQHEFWRVLLNQGWRILKNAGYISLLIDYPYAQVDLRLDQLIDTYANPQHTWQRKTIKPPPYYYEGAGTHSYEHFLKQKSYIIRLTKISD
jgi:hypothetical protein